MVRFPSDTGCKDGARLLFPQPHAPLSPAQGWGGRAFPELLASPNLLPAGRVHAPARSRPLAERGNDSKEKIVCQDQVKKSRPSRYTRLEDRGSLKWRGRVSSSPGRMWREAAETSTGVRRK